MQVDGDSAEVVREERVEAGEQVVSGRKEKGRRRTENLKCN